MPHQSPSVDDAQLRLAAVLRRSIHLVVGRDLTAGQLDAVTTALVPLIDALQSAPPRQRDLSQWKDRDLTDQPADGEPFPDSLYRPVSGSGNPFSVPMTMYRDGDAVLSTVTLDSAFEGAPGRSHGGFVSAIFDDLFGSLPMLHGKIAFTGSLTVNYVAPSPVHEPVVYRGWIDRIEGKKMYIAGDARHGDVVVSTATALFIDATETMARLYGA